MVLDCSSQRLGTPTCPCISSAKEHMPLPHKSCVILPSFTRRALYLHCALQRGPCIFTPHSSGGHCIFTLHSRGGHRIFTPHSRGGHCIFTPHSRRGRCTFTPHSKFWKFLFQTNKLFVLYKPVKCSTLC